MNVIDTIAAIATSSNNGGISVIRISGEDSFHIIDKIYKSRTGNKVLSDFPSHTIHYGFIMDGESIVDEVIVLLMRGPSSYTREDVVEIDCHGGAFVSRAILDLVVKNGARVAEPGEFTKRAFLNGRIDLSQAEAVMDILNAKNKYALQSSVNTLRGDVKEAIVNLREALVRDIAYVEAALDDPEHISLDGYPSKLADKTKDYLIKLNHILSNCENGRILMEGVRTVIVGKPNVGKSSLLNLLLGQDRAIVTDIPGTTRDTLEEDVRIAEVFLKITDTAGIHNTEDKVEQIGIKKALKSLETADFIINVVDSSNQLDEEDHELLKLEAEIPGVVLLNKSDLNTVVIEEDIKQFTNRSIISISAASGEGLNELEELIRKMFYQDELSFNDEIYIHNARQKEALRASIESLNKVLEGINMEMSEDFLSIDLTDAYEELGKIIGETVEDDIIDTIFREFCMGK